MESCRSDGGVFLITLGSVLPVAYAAYWMERSVAGVLGYVAIFCAIFAGIWIAQYLGWRAKINRINKKIALTNKISRPIINSYKNIVVL